MYFSTIEIYSLITVRPHFGFQKSFNVDGLAIRFFFNTITDFNPTICIFFNNEASLIKKFIHLASPS